MKNVFVFFFITLTLSACSSNKRTEEVEDEQVNVFIMKPGNVNQSMVKRLKFFSCITLLKFLEIEKIEPFNVTKYKVLFHAEDGEEIVHTFDESGACPVEQNT